MKHYVILIAALLTLSACHQAEVDTANKQKDSLNQVILMRDSSINEALNVFLEIERNLNEVTIKEKVIVINKRKGGEMNLSTEERINTQINSINSIMERNRELIKSLNKKVNEAGFKNAAMLKTIVLLNNKLLEKDMELKSLGQQLQETNAKVIVLETIGEDLRNQNNQNAASIAQLTGSLHTAYYIVGTSKELKDMNIIDSKGGVLGIGKTKQLKKDFDKSVFTCIDYTNVLIIPVSGKDVKLISNHPIESYFLETNGTMKDYTSNIVILDAEKFWSVSKYLVVTKKIS